MPQTAEIPHVNLSTDTPSGFFNSALMEIESYFDFPSSGDLKNCQDSFKSPRITPSTSPALNPQFRAIPGGWATVREPLGPFEPFASEAPVSKADIPTCRPDSTAHLQTTTTNTFVGQLSPPNSSSNSPDKHIVSGDISPLDCLISYRPSGTSRRVHGQVTPPEDINKSPLFTQLPTALVLPMRLTPPEGSVAGSPCSMSPSLHPVGWLQNQEPPPTGASGGAANKHQSMAKRRRSTSIGTAQNSRKQRKSIPDEDQPPEIQEAKRRRFLERNRVAASKCRQKKKAWMKDLEADAREAQNMSKQLKACVSLLKEEILQLKNELLKHNTCDCLPIRQYLSNEAKRLAADSGGGANNKIPTLITSPALVPEMTGFVSTNPPKEKPPSRQDAMISTDLPNPAPAAREFDLNSVDPQSPLG